MIKTQKDWLPWLQAQLGPNGRSCNWTPALPLLSLGLSCHCARVTEQGSCLHPLHSCSLPPEGGRAATQLVPCVRGKFLELPDAQRIHTVSGTTALPGALNVKGPVPPWSR